MTNEIPTPNALWQIRIHDEPPLAAMSLEDIRRRAERIAAHEQRSRWAGPFGLAVFAVSFGVRFTFDDSLVPRVADAFGFGASLLMAWRAYRIHRRYPLPQLGVMDGMRAYQGTLRRVRALNEIAWQTAMLMLIALIIQRIGTVMVPGGGGWSAMIFHIVVTPVLLWALLRYRSYGRRLGQRIEELDLSEM